MSSQKTKKIKTCYHNAIYAYNKCVKKSCKKQKESCLIPERDCFQTGSDYYTSCKLKHLKYSPHLYYRYFTVEIDKEEKNSHLKLFNQFYDGNGSLTKSTILNHAYEEDSDEIDGVSFNKGSCFEDDPLDENTVLVEFAIRKRNGLRDDAIGNFNVMRYPYVYYDLEDNSYADHHPNMYIFSLSPENVEIKAVYVPKDFNKKKLKKLKKDSQLSDGNLKNPYNIWNVHQIKHTGIDIDVEPTS